VVHLYRFKDLNIVLDVNSGAVHAASDAVFDILSFCEGGFLSNEQLAKVFEDLSEEYSIETLSEAMSEIGELVSSGMLLTPDPRQEEITPEGRGAVIKAMCLHVAHDCNMRCAYCFADGGDFSGLRGLMPLQTGKAAIDFLLEQSGSRHNLELDFFGGEPLMNFDVVKELVLYGREREKEYGKHIRFTLTTNGLLLDEMKTEFINEYMDNVILSIDGRQETNDRMRKTVSGEGTYNYIIDNLTRFAEIRKAAVFPKSNLYYVRGTFTDFNKDFSKDVQHLANLGFSNISIEPAVTDKNDSWALDEKGISELFAEYDRLADIMIVAEEAGKPISFFHFNVDLDQGPCVFKRASGCGAGTAYVAVTPEGDIYPCHQFVGEEEYKLGNVLDDVFENQLFETFEKANIFSKPECQDCWAKFYCSGGCHANALHMNGSLYKPHSLSCELEKKRLEIAIGLVAKRVT
jgi:six-Cys-in-45 modification radical SAM protein